MRNISRWIAFTAVLSLLFGAVMVRAQDPTAVPTIDPAMQPTSEAMEHSMSGMVTCDSDLILNLYIAEHYFGYGGVMSMMSGESTMVDVTTIDKGQYAPLFEATMSSTAPTTMTQEQMQSISDMMAMDDSTMMPAGTDMNTMSMLSPVSVSGEDAACTTLRTQLNRFYTILAYQDMNMGSSTESTSTDSTSMATDNAVNFGTILSGTTEIPGPGDPDGTGTAAVTLDIANGQACYNFSVQNLALPAAAAHIHRGAAGESGPVVVPFDIAPDANGNAASCVLVDAALLQEIATNPAGFYINVHTSEFPDGAIRGQVSG